jgi:hypothetical protein
MEKEFLDPLLFVVIYARCRLLTNPFSSLRAVSSYKHQNLYDKTKIEWNKALYNGWLGDLARVKQNTGRWAFGEA